MIEDTNPVAQNPGNLAGTKSANPEAVQSACRPISEPECRPTFHTSFLLFLLPV
jgi:hypothetical protein